MRNRVFIIIGSIFAFLLIIIAAISILSQTSYFRNTLRSLIEKAVSSSTGQIFTIGKIEGDLIRGVKLKDISFKIQGEDFVYVKEATVTYSLALMFDSSMLFSRAIPLNNVYASGVDIKLVRRNDGDWDVEKLAGEEEHGLKEGIKRSLRWSILIANADIKDVKITLDDSVNKEVFNVWIPDIDCSINLVGLTEKIDINLKNTDLNTSLKQLNIQGLSTKFIYTKDNTQIRGLKGNLNGIKVKFDGEIDDFIEPRFKFEASAYGIDIEKGVLNVEVEKAEGQYKSPEDIQAEFKLKVPDSEIMGKKIEGSIGKVKIAGTDIEVQKGLLKSELGETSFNGSAKLDRILKKKGVNDFDFKIALKDIETSEILPLIGQKIKVTNTDLSARLNANFDASGRWKKVEDLEAKVNFHNFELKGNRAGELDLRGLIEASKSNVKLDVSSKLNKVNFALILGDEKYTSDLNSNLNIKGYIPLRGPLLENLTASVQAEILSSSAYGINLAQGKIDASYGGQTLDIRSFYLVTDSFKLEANGTRKEKGVDLNYDADINNLNLISKFFPEINLKGSLKSTGRVQGEIKKPRVTFSATASDFGYKDIEVKSANLKGDSLVNLESPEIQFEGNLKEIKFQDRKIKSIDIQAKSDGKGLRGNLSILQDAKRSGQINLRLDDLTAKEKNLDIEKIKLSLKNQVIENKDTIKVKILPNQLIVKSLNLYHEDNSVLGNADLVFDGNMSADLELKKINLSDISQILGLKTPMAGIVIGPIKLKGTLEKPNLTANITTKNLGYGEFKSYDSNLNLSYSNKNLGLNLDLSDKTREILSAKGTVNVDLNLKNIGENVKKAVFDITINSNDFNLSSFTNFNSGVQELTGIISGNANLKGTTVNPNIMANLRARDLSFREFKYDKVSFNTSYLNKQLDLNLDIQDKGRGILLAKGKADIDLDLIKIRENLDRASFDLTMKSDGIDLSPLAKLNEEIKYIKGLAVLDFRAYGKVSSPSVRGEVKLQDVLLRINSLRDEIKITNGIIEMEGDRGFLKTLEIQTAEGKGVFEGDINFNELSYDINGKMNNLQIMPKGITARVDGNIEIKGSDGKINISGATKVRGARIKLPELPTKKLEDIKFVDEGEEEFTIAETKQTDYYRDSVAMDLKVNIPGNAWVKGKGANIEIKGKIGVTKKYTQQLILTGNITTVRGTYEFFGKLFKIKQGEVSFRGTPDINPFLDVKALYKVSSVNVFVNVSGTAEKPNIQLSSEPPMDQSDIFSYLVFGTSTDRLGVGERASLEEKAAQAVALMAAGQLKNLVGEQFGLDVISLSGGGGGFQGTEVEVGKYLTDKLYVAYQRSSPFTQTVIQSASTAPVVIDQAHIVYQMFDFLTLESQISGYQSGADVFFNFSY